MPKDRTVATLALAGGVQPPPHASDGGSSLDAPRAFRVHAASKANLNGPVFALDSERLEWAFNALVALVALVLVAPLMLLIALAVKLTSPGGVFYSQVRVGLDRRAGDPRDRFHVPFRNADFGGTPFTIYKFRTMRMGAELGTGAVWATPGDARVTTVGRILRATRLDELPQFVNVLKGDMNIVGPRPERPDLFLEICGDIPEFQRRQRVKPGITGWAQINQSYDTCIDSVRSKLDYDMEYIRTKSLRRDCAIMLRTVPVMLLRSGGW